MRRKYAAVPTQFWSLRQSLEAVALAVLVQGLQEGAQLADRLLLCRRQADVMTVRTVDFLWADGLSAGVTKAWVGTSDEDVTDWYSFCRDGFSKEMLACPMQVALF